MKLILCSLLVVALGCSSSNESQLKDEPKPVSTCGVTNPVQELGWLKDIVDKAEEDKLTKAYKGNYMGTIYLESYDNRPVFVCNMAMGSGGIGARVYYCDGQKVELNTPEDVETFFKRIDKKNIVYTNVP